LPYIHCNEHRAKDSLNHSLPTLSFGSEINRIFDRFRHPMIIISDAGSEHNVQVGFSAKAFSQYFFFFSKKIMEISKKVLYYIIRSNNIGDLFGCFW